MALERGGFPLPLPNAEDILTPGLRGRLPGRHRHALLPRRRSNVLPHRFSGASWLLFAFNLLHRHPVVPPRFNLTSTMKNILRSLLGLSAPARPLRRCSVDGIPVTLTSADPRRNPPPRPPVPWPRLPRTSTPSIQVRISAPTRRPMRTVVAIPDARRERATAAAPPSRPPQQPMRACAVARRPRRLDRHDHLAATPRNASRAARSRDQIVV